ncbi:FtsB family cell division protein [Ascidiimonas aurantiaca]|uniref:FtsB family cell division protein n=1 Tax=Ascidiimonas aurantiaca TaxID=1685432 RepID=UPI0030EE36D3
MKLKELRQKKWFRIFGNIYVLILTVFAVWMLFFDSNAYLTHRELNKEIQKLEKQRKHLQTEIQKDKKMIEKLDTEEGLEKYAREQYYLKRSNEEIYLIEDPDSIKQKKNND